jgi:hypothetical protein
MLIDTDVLIWYMRGNPRASRALDGIAEPSISVVTYMELIQGMRNKRELQALRGALRDWGAPVLHLSDAVSVKALFYVEQHFHSHSLRLADALIAATAVVNGLRLLTANTKHYGMIKDLAIERFRPG